MNNKSESLSIRLTSELMERLDAVVESQGKTRAQYIRELIEVAAANQWRIEYKLVTEPEKALSE
jgi:predicted DNA-binding protein